MRSRRLAVMVSTLAVVAGLGVAIWPQEAGAVIGYQPVPQHVLGHQRLEHLVVIANGRVYVGGILHRGQERRRDRRPTATWPRSTRRPAR